MRALEYKHNIYLYLYDPMQRLGGAEYPGTGKETYSYDGAGNRIRKQTQDYVEDYLYDECSRLRWTEPVCILCE